MSDMELSAKLCGWIDCNTVDNDFIAHPDFVYDKLLELETEITKLQAEITELKVLNSTQENLLRASVEWMDKKGCPVPYDFRVAFEMPQRRGE